MHRRLAALPFCHVTCVNGLTPCGCRDVRSSSAVTSSSSSWARFRRRSRRPVSGRVRLLADPLSSSAAIACSSPASGEGGGAHRPPLRARVPQSSRSLVRSSRSSSCAIAGRTCTRQAGPRLQLIAGHCGCSRGDAPPARCVVAAAARPRLKPLSSGAAPLGPHRRPRAIPPPSPLVAPPPCRRAVASSSSTA